MEQNELEMKYALLEKTVQSLVTDFEELQGEIKDLQKSQNKSEVQYTEMNGKLDMLISTMSKIENKVEKVDNKSKIDWIQVATTAIIAFLASGGSTLLNNIFGK